MGLLKKVAFAGKTYLRDDEDGSATIESVLWMPMFLLFLALIVNASMLFNAQANLTRIVQDANRQCSVRQLKSPAAVKAYIEGRLDQSVVNDVKTQINSDCGLKAMVSTQVEVTAGHYMILGPFPVLSNLNLIVRGQQMRET